MSALVLLPELELPLDIEPLLLELFMPDELFVPLELFMPDELLMPLELFDPVVDDEPLDGCASSVCEVPALEGVVLVLLDVVPMVPMAPVVPAVPIVPMFELLLVEPGC